MLFTNLLETDFYLHAGSISCLYSEKTNRPLAGSFIFNSFHARPHLNTIQEVISTIIHEVFHSIFFDMLIFPKYPLNSKKESAIYKDKDGTSRIRSDHFIQFAREYFDCKNF